MTNQKHCPTRVRKAIDPVQDEREPRGWDDGLLQVIRNWLDNLLQEAVFREVFGCMAGELVPVSQDCSYGTAFRTGFTSTNVQAMTRGFVAPEDHDKFEGIVTLSLGYNSHVPGQLVLDMELRCGRSTQRVRGNARQLGSTMERMVEMLTSFVHEARAIRDMKLMVTQGGGAISPRSVFSRHMGMERRSRQDASRHWQDTVPAMYRQARLWEAMADILAWARDMGKDPDFMEVFGAITFGFLPSMDPGVPNGGTWQGFVMEFHSTNAVRLGDAPWEPDHRNVGHEIGVAIHVLVDERMNPLFGYNLSLHGVKIPHGPDTWLPGLSGMLSGLEGKLARRIMDVLCSRDRIRGNAAR